MNIDIQQTEIIPKASVEIKDESQSIFNKDKADINFVVAQNIVEKE